MRAVISANALLQHCAHHSNSQVNWSGSDFFSVSGKIMLPTFGRYHNFGGDDGNRTHDPLLAGQVLSQLSYTPMCIYGLFASPESNSMTNAYAGQVLSPLSYTPHINWGRSLKIEQQKIGSNTAVYVSSNRLRQVRENLPWSP